MERALKEYPNLKYTLQQGIPSYDEIHQDKKDRCKSVYFLDYCKPGSEIVSARTLRKQRIKLPEGTKIPETIYKASYRDSSNATALGLNIKPLKLGKPQDNLPNDFQVKIATSFPAGKSEYQDTISDTGEIIIEDNLLRRQTNGKCCNYYYQSSPITCKSKREENELYPYRQSIAKYDSCDGNCHPANTANLYNNLHCYCHECQRQMKCSDAKWKFQQNFPITCTLRDDELPNFYKMMVQKNRFKTTYKDSYGKKYSYPHHCKYNLIKCHPIREDDLCYPIQTEVYPKPQSKRSSLGNNPAYQIEARKNDKVYNGGLTSRPWRSEYMDGISKTGQRILKEKLLVNKQIGPP